MTVSFDTWTWLEYFTGSKRGERARQLVQSSEEICTSALSLTELKSKFMREKRPYEEHLNFVIKRSRIVPLSAEIALQAADYMARGLHTSDAVIYATSQSARTVLLTGDKDLAKYPDVEML